MFMWNIIIELQIQYWNYWTMNMEIQIIEHWIYEKMNYVKKVMFGGEGGANLYLQQNPTQIFLKSSWIE